MKKPWENDSCEQVRAYYTYYTVPQAAMLWCGVPPDQVDEELRLAEPIALTNEYGRHVLRHPYIRCLEPRCRVLQEAIDQGKLKVGRDGGESFFVSGSGHVAYSRRTLKREDLKAWIAETFPTDKPAFLFDEIERNTHTAINADTFRALQADRDALQARLEKATIWTTDTKHKMNALQGENDSLRAMVEKMKTPGERAETTYLNIIGGLLDLMLRKSPAGKPQSVFDNQAAIITALLGHYEGKPGISARTLEDKFAAAKRSLKAT